MVFQFSLLYTASVMSVIHESGREHVQALPTVFPYPTSFDSRGGHKRGGGWKGEEGAIFADSWQDNVSKAWDLIPQANMQEAAGLPSKVRIF